MKLNSLILLTTMIITLSSDIYSPHSILRNSNKTNLFIYVDVVESTTEDYQKTKFQTYYSIFNSIDFSPGEYLIYEDETDYSIWAISINTREKYFLTDEYYLIGSTNGEYLLSYEQYENSRQINYFNILTDETFSINAPIGENCFYFTHVFDLDYIVSICPDVNWNYFIQVFYPSELSTIRLDPFEKNENQFGGFYLSPDGKYLAYHMPGLFLIDTDCFKAPETCNEKTLGPYNGPMDTDQFYSCHHAWSPDSQKIASVSANGTAVYLFRIDTRRFQKVFNVLDGVKAIAWSQNGEGLYYSTGAYSSIEENPGEIRYHDLKTGEDSLFLENGYVLFTLTVE